MGIHIVKRIIVLIVRLVLLGIIGWFAYDLRMSAIRTFGRVIHEFDPWFNMRATQYLADNGWSKFFKWYDYRSWYPLGRPVGTTIYPGMQITSVAIWKTLNMAGIPMSLNDVCCFVPVWGGVMASMLLGLLACECSNSSNVGIVAAGVMAIIPAHLMRSVGGGYDNESVAMTAMCATFYFWCRSLRTPDSWPIGLVAGLSYFYMVAVWGGYIFVLNMIGVHAAVLVLFGRYSTKLHRAYTLFYTIGTLGAIQVPIVGWTPVRSLEQICPLILFFGFQLLEFCAIWQRMKKMTTIKFNLFRLMVFGIAGIVFAIIVQILYPLGYFGPLSARIRGLFLKHTRTGNPLVDSVAEHQPANPQAYAHYLQNTYYIAPVGFLFLFIVQSDTKYFLLSYAVVAYYFSTKMARLIILLGPIVSALTGVAFGYALDWSAAQFFDVNKKTETPYTDVHRDQRCQDKEKVKTEKGKEKVKTEKGKTRKTNKRQSKNKPPIQKEEDKTEDKTEDKRWLPLRIATYPFRLLISFYNNRFIRWLRKLATIGILLGTVYFAKEFNEYCQSKVESMSQPSIMFKGKLSNGEEIMVDDYREAYWWLRDNTKPDARVMAWWDYGYQISGIANRTTIADGNTWNHEHIALLGRCLSSPEKKAHQIIRHLADYVLIWAGGGGDDLAKSPHMARIGNSVFDDICPNDPTCKRFGFNKQGPTPMMAKSLLYKMHSHNLRPQVNVDRNRFQHAFTSKHGKVRIFKVRSVSKKSKDWIADPANRLCDAPGSWYCSGQYPPALDEVLKKRKSFSQLEDFNKQRDAKADEYHRQYHKAMGT